MIATAPGASIRNRDMTAAWRHIDFVLLDMIMPGLSGRETFRAMREVDPDVNVLLSSGYSVEGEAQEILAEGVRGFIQKPFLPKVLADAVAEALD